MSEQEAEGQEPEAIELPSTGSEAFGALMDALAPDTDAEEAAPADDADAAAPDGAGSAPADDSAAGAGDATAAGEAGGSDGEQSVPDADAAAGAAGAAGAATESGGDGQDSGVGELDAATLTPKWGEISKGLEERNLKAHREAAYTETREEYGRYFDALQRHPRELVGQEVPSVNSEGMETLRDSAEAKEWQEAVKVLLQREISSRADKRVEENRGSIETLHGSIALFQNNADLIPRTKGFDRELADRFADMMGDYEVRVDGKLQGYAIDPQPIINRLRNQIKTEREKKPAAAAPAVKAAPAAKAAAPARSPQAGIQSKAGSGGAETEDYSVFFGTAGLPNIRI